MPLKERKTKSVNGAIQPLKKTANGIHVCCDTELLFHHHVSHSQAPVQSNTDKTLAITYHKIKTCWPVQVHLSHKYSNQVNTLIRCIQLWELLKRISAQTCHVNKNSRMSTLRANWVDTLSTHFLYDSKFVNKTCWTNCDIHIYLKAPTINGLHIGDFFYFL